MLLTRFWKNRQGSIAPLFGLAIIPLIGGVGAAVDYTRASAARTALQSSLDSAALMLSKTAPLQTTSELQTEATSYVKAMFTSDTAKNVTVSAAYSTTNGSQIVLTSNATVQTSFMSVLGIDAINITASTTATWGNTRLRVALVLDNTGSMAQSGKITALKTATENLLTQLQTAVVTPGDVYVSIIPFVDAVNLGSANYKATWIDWTDWNAVNGKCSSTKYTTQGACVGAKKTWTPANHSTWNGCVTDRGLPITNGPDIPSSGNYDENVSPPVAGNLASLYPAFQAPSCPQVAIGLNYDWSAMTTEVKNMQPGGSTDQPIGLVWGWQTLVGGGPFAAPSMDPNYQYQQVIILLSDGLNTQDRWYGNGSSTSTQVDSRMYDQNGNGTCANIKAAGITIYTIQVNTDGSPTSTLLQDCASDPGKFFLLTSADEIVTTFGQIGTALSNLRLAM
jgi:Flp pilus assembly protein TadG